MKSKKKNRREKNNERVIRIKRMSVFGLKIETRDNFDEDNYEDFQNVRREIKDTTQSHRIGPAPVQDFNSKQNYHSSTSPGSLDSDLEEHDSLKDTPTTNNVSKAGCRGLIMYFSKLGRSEGDELMDFEFVDSLLRGGADINFPDRHGQTCMHEIARGWHTDVAQFALTRKAEIDKCDNYGRTPLHLATAVNYPEMVFWLLNNGAKIDAKTKGEHQTPIHYAAKYNAVDAMKVLIHMGANIGDRDYKNRTPLFVAAEMGRSEACRFLLEQGSPAGVYDDGGTSALTLMIEKMPDIAKIALGQFEVSDKALRKKYFYLNYLESETWKRRATIKGKPLRQSKARTPLEAICRYNENELIMHPVILRLIAIKWQLFGKFHTAKNTCLNLLYTILWTILGVTMPKDERKSFYTPLADRSWRIVLETLSLGMAFYFIARQVLDFRQSEKLTSQYKEWKRRETERDLQYCHARWPEERRYLTSEISLIKTSSKKYFKNGWNVFELFTNIALASVVVTRIMALTDSSHTFVGVHYKAFSIFLIMLWLRFMRSCQCYQSLGPFITMLGHVITDTMKFGFLFMEFFVPYVCAFWILFGGHPGSQFYYFNDVLYNVFLMTLVDEYDRDDIMSEDKVMAQILVGTYLAIASVVCINLYIALMSQTFTRVYQNAKATAFMQQAYHLLNIESTLSRKQKNRVKRFMMTECSPQIVYDAGLNDDDDDDQSKIMMYRMVQSIQEIKDKLLVLVMNSTNGIVQNGEEENISLTDVNIQVEIVRRKCDSLESQLDDLQSYMHQIKDIIETKTLVETEQLVNADDVLRALPNTKNDVGKLREDAEISNFDADPESIRKISNIEEKLNRVIDVLCQTYQQRQPPFLNKANFHYDVIPAYTETHNVAPPSRNWYCESDSPYSSLNNKDHYYLKRQRQYYEDRRSTYDPRHTHYVDSEKSETLSDFEEFQRFKEFKKSSMRKEMRDQISTVSPPSYDYRKGRTESLNSRNNETERNFNTFPSSRKTKKSKRPNSNDSNISDGRHNQNKYRLEHFTDDLSDEYRRAVMMRERYQGRRTNSILSNQDPNIEMLNKKRSRLLSDASSNYNRRNSSRSVDLTRRNSNKSQDLSDSRDDLVEVKSYDDIGKTIRTQPQSIMLADMKEMEYDSNESITVSSLGSNRKSIGQSEEPTQRFSQSEEQTQRFSQSKEEAPHSNESMPFSSQTRELSSLIDSCERTQKSSQSGKRKLIHSQSENDNEVVNELLNNNKMRQNIIVSTDSESDNSFQGVHKKSLHSLLKRYGLDPEKFEQQVEETQKRSQSTSSELENINLTELTQQEDENTEYSDTLADSVYTNGDVNTPEQSQGVKTGYTTDEEIKYEGSFEEDMLPEDSDGVNKSIEANIDKNESETDINQIESESRYRDFEDENNNMNASDTDPLINDKRKPIVKINTKQRRQTFTLLHLGQSLKDTTL